MGLQAVCSRCAWFGRCGRLPKKTRRLKKLQTVCWMKCRRFSDGAALRCSMEQDEGNFDAAVCLPCEISCQVLAHPGHGRITPERKRFTDSCRHCFG